MIGIGGGMSTSSAGAVPCRRGAHDEGIVDDRRRAGLSGTAACAASPPTGRQYCAMLDWACRCRRRLCLPPRLGGGAVISAIVVPIPLFAVLVLLPAVRDRGPVAMIPVDDEVGRIVGGVGEGRPTSYRYGSSRGKTIGGRGRGSSCWPLRRGRLLPGHNMSARRYKIQ